MQKIVCNPLDKKLTMEKPETCGKCEYWRGCCVRNLNAPLSMYSANDKACLFAELRTSKLLPLSFPAWW